uniref:hypothetical protein n=1 Tax=Bacillus thuringiensis TaxID=1428 RepID=UPI00202B13E7|nr:hypothetical protein [Bacillus thuringiensis]UQM91585.1 hypothetical protein SY271_000783 [Bacillus thuringiensis]UQM92745.1 hypothetical protein SY621A_000100 [Bacillus thuringiensis]
MAKIKDLNIKGSVGIMPFVIKELEFETYEEAEKTLKLIQFPMRKPNAKIIEV